MTTRAIRIWTFAATVLALSAQPVFANTLFQSIPDLTVAPVAYFADSAGAPYDVFTLASKSRITSITLAIGNKSEPSNIDVAVLRFVSGEALAPLFVNVSGLLYTVQSTVDGTDVVNIDMSGLDSLDNPALNAGTYALAFLGDGGELVVPFFSTTDGQGNMGLFGGSIFLKPSSRSLGFVVEGDVLDSATPLPAALPLFATGLGAFGLLGWRRKRKSVAAIAA